MLRSPASSANSAAPITGDGKTVTASTPLLDLTQTWNAGGVTFTGIKANITDTASAAGSLLLDLQVATVSKFSVRKDGQLTIGTFFMNGGGVGTGTNSLTAGYYFGAGGDLFISRDAANILALRNTTSAQTFNVYNTYTDASNYERGFARWNGNVFEIGNEGAGTGSSSRWTAFTSGGTRRWEITGSGHFQADVDATYDIGASGANRPRNIFASGGGTFGGTLIASTFSGTSVVVTGTVQTGTHTVAGLGAGVKAQRDFVTDATVAASGNFGAIVAGGGANNVPVYYDGTNWRIG